MDDIWRDRGGDSRDVSFAEDMVTRVLRGSTLSRPRVPTTRPMAVSGVRAASPPPWQDRQVEVDRRGGVVGSGRGVVGVESTPARSTTADSASVLRALESFDAALEREEARGGMVGADASRELEAYLDDGVDRGNTKFSGVLWAMGAVVDALDGLGEGVSSEGVSEQSVAAAKLSLANAVVGEGEEEEEEEDNRNVFRGLEGRISSAVASLPFGDREGLARVLEEGDDAEQSRRRRRRRSRGNDARGGSLEIPPLPSVGSLSSLKFPVALLRRALERGSTEMGVGEVADVIAERIGDIVSRRDAQWRRQVLDVIVWSRATISTLARKTQIAEEEKRKIHTELSEQSQISTSELVSLRSQLEEIRQQNRSLQQRCEELEAGKKELQGVLEGERHDVKDVYSKLRKTESEKSELKDENRRLDSERSRLQESIHRLERLQEESLRQKQSLERQLQEVTLTNTALEQEIAKHQASAHEHHTLMSRLDALESRARAAEAEVSRAKAQARDSEEQAEQIRAAMLRGRAELRNLEQISKDREHTLQRSLDDAKDVIDTLEAKITDLTARLQVAETQTKRAQERTVLLRAALTSQTTHHPSSNSHPPQHIPSSDSVLSFLQDHSPPRSTSNRVALAAADAADRIRMATSRAPHSRDSLHSPARSESLSVPRSALLERRRASIQSDTPDIPLPPAINRTPPKQNE